MGIAADTESGFFVVGGPVQPDRPSYVFREADHELRERLRQREFCHVFAPHHVGKTSLMAQTAHRLRGDGCDVATLDLADIGGRSVADDIGRWYYSFAYRVVRELRIRSDMTSWWQERAGLTIRQRLRDFFLEVVLANTSRPVVLFLDRIDAVALQPEAMDLFDAIRGCYDARATEPEYQRLAFALLGSAGAERLLTRRQDSLLAVSAPVTLGDFSPEELRQLARGLGSPAGEAAAVADRIWHWTAGQPYLAQKLCRALVRNGPARIDETAVDALVERLFLGRSALREDSHLAWLAARLAQPGPQRVARLTLYGRVRKGGRVPVDTASAAQRELLDLGLLVDADGVLAPRNRIYAGTFTALWVNRNLPFSWRGVALAAAVVMLLVAAPVWYREYLPRPYVRALQADRQEFVVASEAWQRLRMFPGFRRHADQLFLDYLTRQSRRATRLPEVQRIGQRLAGLPGGTARAEVLLAEFWDRRANLMAQRGDRDGALLYTLEALGKPTPERETRLAELLGASFPQLTATIRPGPPLVDLEVDPESGLVTTLDAEHEVVVWRTQGSAPASEQRLRLTAEEVRPLQQRRVVEISRLGRRLALVLHVDHERPQDLELLLRAPSGRQAVLRVADAFAAERTGTFRFDSRRHPALQPLLEQDAAGTWTAFFADTKAGRAGRLLGWELSIDDVVARAAAEGSSDSSIPQPQAAVAMASLLAPAGRRALAWPVDADTRGDVLVWDVTAAQVLARLPRPAALSAARFALGHSAVLFIAERELELRDATSGRLIGRLPLRPGARLGPVLSASGRYLVLDSEVRPGIRALELWDLNGLKALGQITTGARVSAVAVDPVGTLLAVGDGERFVRVWRVRDQSLLAECEHPAAPLAIQFDPTSRYLATQDEIDRVRLWDISRQCRAINGRRGNGPWLVSFAPDGSGALVGNFSRGFEYLRLPGGERLGAALQPGMSAAGSAPASRAAHPKFLANRGGIVTYDGRKAVKLWSAPWDAGASLPVLPPGAAELRFSPDRRQLALGTVAGEVRLVSLEEAAPLRFDPDGGPAFIGHRSAVTALAFDPVGRLVASGSLEGTVRVWEAANGIPRDFFAVHGDGAVHDLAFLPDGRALVSASGGSVLVLDPARGGVQARLAIEAEQAQLAIASDGAYVLIAGDRGGVTRWDWRGGTASALGGADYRVRRVALSDDGQLLATAGADRVVRLWRPQSGLPLRRAFTAAAPVDALWFGPGGHSLGVQAGAWLHFLTIEAAGLGLQRSRPLPDADTLVAPGGQREWLLLAAASSATPTLLRMSDAGSWASGLPEKWSADDIRGRLRLVVNEMGEIRAP